VGLEGGCAEEDVHDEDGGDVIEPAEVDAQSKLYPKFAGLILWAQPWTIERLWYQGKCAHEVSPMILDSGVECESQSLEPEPEPSR
jgi:hypothetical protein